MNNYLIAVLVVILILVVGFLLSICIFVLKEDPCKNDSSARMFSMMRTILGSKLSDEEKVRQLLNQVNLYHLDSQGSVFIELMDFIAFHLGKKDS